MTPDQILALVGALLAAEPSPAAFPGPDGIGADPRYPVTATPCQRPLAPYELEGRTIFCGEVRVPADHSAPEGPTIGLGFAVLKAKSLSPAPDPLVFLQGGPGATVVDALQGFAGMFQDWRIRRDVITFDQRGDGVSNELTACHAATGAHLEALVKEQAGQDGDTPSEDIAKACREELASRESPVSLINTEQNARDVAALMSALGYAEWNFYGGSYGTKLGLEVLRQDPEGLRAAIIDGVAPAEVHLYDELAGPYDDAAWALFEQCRADAQCDAAYPNLQARFNALAVKLAGDPIPGGRGVPAVTPGLLTRLISARNAPGVLTGITAWLPKIITELEQGSTATLDAVLDEEIPPKPTPETALARVPYAVTADEKALASAALKLAEQQQALDEAMTGVLAQLGADAAARGAGPQAAPRAFDIALDAAAKALETPQDRLAFVTDYAALRDGERSREALDKLLTEHFAEPELSRLEGMLAAMTEQELSRVFARIEADLRPFEKAFAYSFALEVYACQEDMPYNNLDNARAFNAALKVPAMGIGINAQLEALYATCTMFEPQPREGFHTPVSSDVPTLVLNGLMDVQTNWKWGGLAAETLSRSTNLVMPESGHGTLVYQQCARDIGVAFIENPEAEVDASCIDDLAVKWVLPDGTRSKGTPWPERHGG